MKLDRSVNPDRKGKYALINLRTNKVEWGNIPAEEFFVIKLQDIYAVKALMAYAQAIQDDPDGDPEYRDEIIELANRANLIDKKRPD